MQNSGKVADDNIIKRLAFRLVKKHMAGFTIESALNVVRMLNSKKLHATVTFLNEHVYNRVKAKYNTNAYVQLVRQLSRLHLDAGISVRLSQLGYGIEESYGEDNLLNIISAAEEGGKFVWLEGEHGSTDVQKLYRKLVQKHRLIGMEIFPDCKDVRKGYNVKVRYYMHSAHIGSKPEGYKGIAQQFARSIADLADRAGSVTVFEKDYRLLSRLINSNTGKRNLIFELPLGYEKKAGSESKQVHGMSVYVPYGKDWVPYIISSIAEGRIKRVATALLDGENEKEGNADAV